MQAYTGITAKKSIIGQRFGRLVVISELKERNKNGHILYHCKCDCGNSKNILGASLRQNLTKSCGCINNMTHGKSHTLEYKIWIGIKNRCNTHGSNKYNKYGGRGITMCKEWVNSFDKFIADMGERLDVSDSIDRIDVNGNYEPNNCRWANKTIQARNRRNNRIISIDGKEKCMSEWALEFNIAISTIHNRIIRGWTPELAVITPAKKNIKG